MSAFEPWGVWWAFVQYEDSPEGKERPVVILDSGEACVVVTPETSHEERNVWGDYDLTYWKYAGLSKPTTIRAGRIIHLQNEALRAKIGRLHIFDILRLRELIR